MFDVALLPMLTALFKAIYAECSNFNLSTMLALTVDENRFIQILHGSLTANGDGQTSLGLLWLSPEAPAMQAMNRHAVLPVNLKSSFAHEPLTDFHFIFNAIAVEFRDKLVPFGWNSVGMQRYLMSATHVTTLKVRLVCSIWSKMMIIQSFFPVEIELLLHHSIQQEIILLPRVCTARAIHLHDQRLHAIERGDE